jgi:DNA-binding MarR family transcriptional regulator
VEISLSDRDEYERLADRIVAAYGVVSQWTARDFKRTRSSYDLTRTQLNILGLVARGQITASQLAERLELTVPTVVRALDALERKSLLRRQRSRLDRREVELALTPEGDRVRLEREAAIRENLVSLLTGMDDEDVQGLVRGFEAMAREAQERSGREKVAG